MADVLEMAKEWRRYASRDLEVATHTANTMWPTPDEIICFHCQQAAEKYLKGFLVLNGIEDPPHIHDLETLCMKCETFGTDFTAITLLCANLTQYGAQPRYPAGIQITPDDMRRALSYAQAVRDFMLATAPSIFQD
jgi:HEPN domain-containing protein